MTRSTDAEYGAQPSSATHQNFSQIRQLHLRLQPLAATGRWSQRPSSNDWVSVRQRCVPSLLIPIHGVTGQVVNYQIRPDQPRISKDGKSLKYETVARSQMALDVPPFVRGQLGDPSIPLWITEGSRKADSAVSKDLCCIALLGVWNFRGTNQYGGKTILPDFDSIALNDRQVFVVFDSDVMIKPAVHGALARLKAVLELRGAPVLLVYLPAGERRAQKQGLDDYLAAGHDVGDLFTLASPALRSSVTEEQFVSTYLETEQGLFWQKPNSLPVPLTNFTARIVSDIREDDGAQRLRRLYEIEAMLRDRTTRFTVPAAQIPGMNWAAEHSGAVCPSRAWHRLWRSCTCRDPNSCRGRSGSATSSPI